MDWSRVMETVIGPVAGAATGLVTSLFGLKVRMDQVERESQRVGPVVAAFEAQKLLHLHLASEVDELRVALQEYQERQDFERRDKSIRDTNADYAKDAELSNFVSEQQERWQQIQRTLGHLEGYLGLSPMPGVPRPSPRPQSRPDYPPLPPPLPPHTPRPILRRKP